MQKCDLKPPKDIQKNVAIFAAEASADIIASRLIEGLKSQFPESTIWGVYGPEVEKRFDLSSFIPIEEFQVMGLVDVMKRIVPIAYNFYQLKKKIKKEQPQLIAFIDQPAFGMRLAKELRAKGYQGTIVQVVAPTVWAYHPERADLMARSFNKLYCLFDFEVPFFEKSGLATLSIGHPILSTLLEKKSNMQKEPILALFPGSRPAEIARNLDLQLEAANEFIKHHPEYTVAVVKSRAMSDQDALRVRALPHCQLIEFEYRYDLMKRASLAIAKSGTVTLELALFEVPTVVVYVLSYVNYLFAKYLLKLKMPFYSIANILLGKELQPELIYPKPSPKDVAKTLQDIDASREAFATGAKEIETIIRKHPDPSSELVRDICELIQKA